MGFTAVNALPTGINAKITKDYGPRPKKSSKIRLDNSRGPTPTAGPDEVTPDTEGQQFDDTKSGGGPKKPQANRRHVLYATLDRAPPKEKEPRQNLPGILSAPVIDPSKQDFAELEALVASIEQTLQEHGIVKVRWRKSRFQRPIFNWNNVPFRLEKQSMNLSPDLIVEIEANFKKVLEKLTSMAVPPQVLPPCIHEGREISLYSFHRAVYGRGGYTTVGRSQLWSIVWEDIEATPVTSVAAASRLKRFYTRYIQPFDIMLEAAGVTSDHLRIPLSYRIGTTEGNEEAIALPHNISVSPVFADTRCQTTSETLVSMCRALPFVSSTIRQRDAEPEDTLNNSENQFWQLAETDAAIHFRARGAQEPTLLPQLRLRNDPCPPDRGVPGHDDGAGVIQELAYSPWSVFSYIDDDIQLDAPVIVAGALHTCTPWTSNDGDAVKTELVHYGAPRTIYVVPASARSNAELRGNIETPQRLASQGIPVYCVDQHAGELVFISPGALSVSIDHGPNIVEKGLFWPLWSGLGGLRHAVCQERTLFNIATRASSEAQVESVRQDLNVVFNEIKSQWDRVQELGLEVERHDGKTTVETKTSELRFFVWIEHDGQNYNVTDYSQQDLKGGRVIAHPKLESMLELLETRLARPDYSVLDYITKGRWQIPEFVAAAQESQIGSLQTIASALATKYPHGTDWLAHYKLKATDNPILFVKGHLPGMPVDNVIDQHLSRLLTDWVDVTKGVAAVASDLENSGTDLMSARARAQRILHQIRANEALDECTTQHQSFLTRLVAILDWAMKANELFKPPVDTSKIQIDTLWHMLTVFPDRRVIASSKGQAMRNLLDLHDILMDWRSNFLRLGSNVDAYTKSELDQVRDMMKTVPLNPNERAMLESILTAADTVLLTGNPTPQLRPRLTETRPLADYSQTLSSALAFIYNWIDTNQMSVAEMLMRAKTNPPEALQIAQRLAPLIQLKVVPDEIEEVIAFVSRQFSQAGLQMPPMWQPPTAVTAPIQAVTAMPRMGHPPQMAQIPQVSGPSHIPQVSGPPQIPQVSGPSGNQPPAPGPGDHLQPRIFQPAATQPAPQQPPQVPQRQLHEQLQLQIQPQHMGPNYPHLQQLAPMRHAAPAYPWTNAPPPGARGPGQ